jgi:hypothetical protein
MKRILSCSKSSVFGAFLIAGSMAVGLSACGKSEPTPPPKVEDTVFGDLVATKERARVDAEKAMAANKQKLEEAMKKAEAESKQ